MSAKIKKGDKVKVMLGKDSGKIGTVEKLFPKEGKVSVSEVNTFKRHVRKYQEIEGGIIEIRKPINLSNVELVCPNCGKTTRVGFMTTNGEKQRMCKKCKKAI